MRALLAHFCAGVLFVIAATANAAEAGKPIRVGLYSEGSCTDPKSREAAWKVISNTSDFQAERITSDTVTSGGLTQYDVIIFPGGTGGGQAKSMGVSGGRALERFIQQGKGFIAICAGGYYCVEGWNADTKALEVVNAETWDSEHWARGEGFINVKVVGANDGDSSRTMWFENGPIFAPASMPYLTPYVPLVKYVTDMAAKGAPTGMMTGRDAVIAAPFGKGRIVAFGPHPELSPELNHWLQNAIRWAARPDDGSPISAQKVLEGKGQ